MGSPIRSEIWACIAGGNADIAARYAALDASLDHGAEGIAGEIFFAVMQTLVVAGENVEPALRHTQEWIDPHTEMAQAIALVVNNYDAGIREWACRDVLLNAHGSDNFTHAPLNVGLTVWGLLYGGGDFERSLLLAVNGGFDTDCTGATVGATLGLKWGREGIPIRWITPIGNGVAVGPGLTGINAPRTLEELTDRTNTLAEALARNPPNLDVPAVPTFCVSLSQLPGTIELSVLDGSPSILWANGELPSAVKRTGCMAWQWHPGASIGKLHHVMALAKGGIRLFIDEALVVDCPPGQPYVPAPHRCPAGSQAPFVPTRPVHFMRVELAYSDAAQMASMMLSTSNFHLAAWSDETLPSAPLLE